MNDPNLKKIVLLVEDDIDLRIEMEMFLGECNYQVITAGNGKEALEKIKSLSDKIHFVVTDIKMPEMDGIDLFKQAQNITNAPFIMTTGFSEIMNLEKAYELGVSEFISKPFTRDEFLACVELIEHQNTESQDSD